MTMWLISSDALGELQACEARFSALTDDQISAFAGVDQRGITQTRGRTAEIAVTGVLTERASLMYQLFGGGNTSYYDIRTAIAQAGANADVDDITLVIDSPGGNVSGLFETVDAIQQSVKPVKLALVTNQAQSAAFALAAQARRIEASNQAAMVGSVGVVVHTSVYDGDVSITSTKAPKKAPDLRTEEGKAILREQLDAMHEIFVSAIAEGRGVATETVDNTYGSGATLIAKDAAKRGMIDGVRGRPILSVVTTDAKSNIDLSGGAIMDLKQLKAEHPGTFDEVFQAGLKAGVDQERDRVSAHLTYGSQSGAMDIALKAVEEGTGLTHSVIAKYNTMGRNNASLDAAADDSTDAEKALSGADTDEKLKTERDRVVDAICGTEVQ